MLKKIIVIISAIIIASIFSCKYLKRNHQKSIYFRFSKEKKEIKIVNLEKVKSLENEKKNKIINIRRIITNNDTLYLGLTRDTEKSISVYDNKYNLLKKITPKIDNKYLFGYHYINKDSILIEYSSDEYEFNDSSFILVNDKGEIQKVYSLKGSRLFTRYNLDFAPDNDEAVSLASNYLGQLKYKDNKVFMHFQKKGGLGNPASKSIPIAGYIDIKEDKFYPINIDYPDITYDGQHFYHDSETYFFSTFSHDGDLLYAFKYTPTILKYNYKTGKVKRVQIKSTVIDTIYSVSSEDKIPKGFDFDMPYPKYQNLQYDSINHRYYRFMLLPKDYGKFQFTVIVADTSFNVIAEGVVGTNLSFNFKNGLIDRFDGLYDMIFNEGDNQQIIAQIKSMNLHRKCINKDLTHYVKDFGKIEKENYTASFMWLDGTCESVVDGTFRFHKYAEELFEENDIYLFLMVQDVDNFKKIMKEKYDLSPDEHKNIIIDSTFEFARYTNYGVNTIPRIIKVRKNKIVKDTIFPGENLGLDYQKFLIDAAKEQKKIKAK